MRRIFTISLSIALAGGMAMAQKPAAPAKPAATTTAAPLLTTVFAGWEAKDAPKAVTDPVQADATNAVVLKEYGFTDGALGSYSRGSETLTMRALRFKDASGAYGAYTFYRESKWPKEDIGTGAASNGNRVIFWVGNIMVDSLFSHMGPMSGSELRELANALHVPEGTKALAPPILQDLPHGSLEGQTTHYAVGPAGYMGSGGVLPAEVVNFALDPEVMTANYSLRSGPATLTIIDYPTMQIAIAQEAKIRAYIQARDKAQPAWPKPLQDSDVASLEVRRSGPLVVLVSGDAIPDESHKLVSLVHFDASMTDMEQPRDSEIAKTSKLLIGIAGFVLIGSCTAIVLGVFFGGGRALYRVARGKPASSMYEAEFTKLDLKD